MSVGWAGPQGWYRVIHNLTLNTRAGNRETIVLFLLADINCNQKIFCFVLIFKFEGI